MGPEGPTRNTAEPKGEIAELQWSPGPSSSTAAERRATTPQAQKPGEIWTTLSGQGQEGWPGNPPLRDNWEPSLLENPRTLSQVQMGTDAAILKLQPQNNIWWVGFLHRGGSTDRWLGNRNTWQMLHLLGTAGREAEWWHRDTVSQVPNNLLLLLRIPTLPDSQLWHYVT